MQCAQRHASDDECSPLFSALLFGIPHYFGYPGKIPGVVLSGFLGWLLSLSVLQTGGIAWALALHFVQDLVIFTLLFAVAKYMHTHEARANATTGQQE
ncbi:MAG: CPBP family intramembrane metalloprotease [Chlorobium sp.]|nr:MAG: CPBP family intramembrane metalloprotease [Chlorobium sp.]